MSRDSTPALLFDMDGTLIDSEPLWQRHIEALASRFGAEWTEADGAGSVGTPMYETAAKLQEKGVALGTPELLQTLSDAVRADVHAQIPWLPGAEELLREVASRGLRAALVTNSDRGNAQGLFEAAPPGSLQFAISGDDVTHAKPNPEPYLTALERLGGGGGIAFEDSLPGAAAARDAGLAVWFVRTHSSPPEFAAGSVASLAEVDLDALLA